VAANRGDTMKNLIIHIGTHKTGTTAIQEFLYKNNNILSQNSMCFFEPVKVDDFALHHNLCLGLLDEMLHSCGIDYKIKWHNTAKYFDDIESYFADLSRYMAEMKLDTAVISSEGFFSTAKIFCNGLISDFPRLLTDEEAYNVDKAIITRLRKLTKDFSARVVVYLRRQDEHFESLYSHYLKSLPFSQVKSPKDYLDSNPHEYHYDKELTIWAEVFGQSAIDPYVYDDELAKKGIVHHFIQKVLMLRGDIGEVTEPRPNLRLQRGVLEFVNKLAAGWPIDKVPITMLQKILDTEVKNENGEGHRYLDVDYEKKFMKTVEKSNSILGVKFFHQGKSPFMEYAPMENSLEGSDKSQVDLSRKLALLYESQLFDRNREIAIISELLHAKAKELEECKKKWDGEWVEMNSQKETTIEEVKKKSDVIKALEDKIYDINKTRLEESERMSAAIYSIKKDKESERHVFERIKEFYRKQESTMLLEISEQNKVITTLRKENNILKDQVDTQKMENDFQKMEIEAKENDIVEQRKNVAFYKNAYEKG
jgi:hypothetical protein